MQRRRGAYILDDYRRYQARGQLSRIAQSLMPILQRHASWGCHIGKGHRGGFGTRHTTARQIENWQPVPDFAGNYGVWHYANRYGALWNGGYQEP